MKTPSRPWFFAPSLLFWLVAIPAFAGQVTDPKTDFVNAFAQFSLALDGTFGDEGSRVLSSLEAMERGLAHWDEIIRTFETTVAGATGTEPRSAARAHLALGGVYLDRSRVADALREFRSNRDSLAGW